MKPLSSHRCNLVAWFLLAVASRAGSQDPTLGWQPLLDRLGLNAEQVAIDPDELALSGGLDTPLAFQRLIDGGGDDHYRAGVFGQGVGYYYGVGILVERSGDDHCEAVWYAQGAAAHKAAGILVDQSGNDTYRVSRYVSQGAANDLSLGFFRDNGGDDSYESYNVAFGTALTNSIALFEEISGDDRYIVHDRRAFGAARNEMRGSLRDMMITVGLFLDRSGLDTYPREPWRNDAMWEWKTHEDSLPLLWTEHGGGMDTRRPGG